MNGPEYPTVAGRLTPDLGLAQYGMPIPQTPGYHPNDSTGPQLSSPPPLQDSDISAMGIEPEVPHFDLQLANAFDVQDPAQLTASQQNGRPNLPTSGGPDISEPDLTEFDLSVPTIELQPALTSTSDLDTFNRPGSLDIVAASDNPLLTAWPDMPNDYDQTAGLDTQSDIAQLDLQDTSWLVPEVLMQTRPGDLAPDALAQLHDDPTYRQLPTTDYRELWMQQHGDNQERSRHQGMLMTGLDQEEHQS